MKWPIVFFLFISTSLYGNVNLDITLMINGKKAHLVKKNVKFEKTYQIELDKYYIKYIVSKNIPQNISDKMYLDPNNQKTIAMDFKISENNQVLATPQIVTIYGKEVIFEAGNRQGHELYKLTIIATETAEEKQNRILSIKRLPVYTESIFPVSYRPIENVEKELKKILSKKGVIKINRKTNSLIVNDTLERMININKKFQSIDI